LKGEIKALATKICLMKEASKDCKNYEKQKKRKTLSALTSLAYGSSSDKKE
jgi:hypothetical protein